MTASRITIATAQARALSLRRQLLSGQPLPTGKAGALRAIQRLGYVQIDTISVVERAHHLTLRTRCPRYIPEHLHLLQARDRAVFEYWAHAASYVPMTDYRYYLSAKARHPRPGTWQERWMREHRGLLTKIKRRIIAEGPMTASEFPNQPGRKRGPWWDWKDEKMALEMLFWGGVLMVSERKGFQRVYDLAERVIPDGADTTKPGKQEEAAFFVRRALGALGPATARDINRYIGVSGQLDRQVERMVASGDVLPITVTGLSRQYYLLREDAEATGTAIGDHRGATFLSPFDNAIILRDRTKALFDFDYALECYVTPAKRRYGYFCLPILWRGQIVGRLDPKADRHERTLLIQNLHVEKPVGREFYGALAAELRDFASFNGCVNVSLSSRVPQALSRRIENQL